MKIHVPYGQIGQIVKNIRLFFYSKPVFWRVFCTWYFTNATAKKSEFHILLILDGNLVVVLCGVLLLLPLFDNGLCCRPPQPAATARTHFFPFNILKSVTKSRYNGTTFPFNSFCCVLQKIRVISS